MRHPLTALPSLSEERVSAVGTGSWSEGVAGPERERDPISGHDRNLSWMSTIDLVCERRRASGVANALFAFSVAALASKFDLSTCT